MKLEIFKSGVKLSGLTINEICAIMNVVSTANDRCFKECDQQANGDYYSNDDFVCTLDKEQREALNNFCSSFNKQLEEITSIINKQYEKSK